MDAVTESEIVAEDAAAAGLNVTHRPDLKIDGHFDTIVVFLSKPHLFKTTLEHYMENGTVEFIVTACRRTAISFWSEFMSSNGYFLVEEKTWDHERVLRWKNEIDGGN